MRLQQIAAPDRIRAVSGNPTLRSNVSAERMIASRSSVSAQKKNRQRARNVLLRMGRTRPMTHYLRHLAVAGVLLQSIAPGTPALSQKSGGILQMPGFTSPASMSIHEESAIAVGIPMMPVFNNLVVFDQHTAQN